MGDYEAAVGGDVVIFVADGTDSDSYGQLEENALLSQGKPTWSCPGSVDD